jgi:alpha-beta hydrolase superfamily lysophospholipase
VSFAGGLAYDRYRTGSSDEWLMRIGPTDASPILFLPPLFEEMNRTRAFLAAIMRALAVEGYGCWLPDLPGTGESESALETCSWDGWRDAARDAGHHVARAAGRTPLVAAVRGGALLDDAVDASRRWRFAPAEGASLSRDMIRASMIKAEEMKGPEVDLAGYRMSEALLADLTAAKIAPVAPVRTVRLRSDRNEADLKVEGPALWRRSEPGNSPELVQLIASDIGDWASRCAVS